MGAIFLIGLGMTEDWSVAAVLGITLVRAAAMLDVCPPRRSIPHVFCAEFARVRTPFRADTMMP